LFISVFKVLDPFFMFLQRHQRSLALGNLNISSAQESTLTTSLSIYFAVATTQSAEASYIWDQLLKALKLEKPSFRSEIKQHLSKLLVSSDLIDTYWLSVHISSTLSHFS